MTKGLEANQTGAEFTSTDYYDSFDNDGFTIAAGAGGAGNGSSQTAVNYCWKAGTAFSNDASSTGVGSIDSSGSVNDTAGFSIVIRTGTGSAGTIKHGLSTTPQMIITKMRNAQESWGVYNVHIGNTKYLKLEGNAAEDSSSGVWNNTTPTSSVLSVGNSALVNGSNKTYVDYIFSERKGYSKFGKYEGASSADGEFIYTGFKPAFFMARATGRSENWYIFDTKRDGYNVDNDQLYPDVNNAEATTDYLDILSNGVKYRYNSVGLNGSGEEYIYMAFAENPFVTSTGVPSCAR